MKCKNNNPPIVFRRLNHLSLLDFGFKKLVKKSSRSYIKGIKTNVEPDELNRFIELTYNYARCFLNKYSSPYSKHLYSQPALFTILSLKTYLDISYREIVRVVELSDRLKQYLGLKKVPDYSTLQKFFKRLPTQIFHEINDAIIENLDLNPSIVAMDGTGFSSSHADKYYASIIRPEYSFYTKCHIAIDVDTRIILYAQAVKGPRNDMKFAMAATRAMKKHKPDYILTDKAYYSEKLRKCINEEINAEDQIPTRGNVKTGHYRKLSLKRFKQEIYNKRSHVEGVFSIIKRLFGGINKSRRTHLQNKETKFKIAAYNIVRFIQLTN